MNVLHGKVILFFDILLAQFEQATNSLSKIY